MGASEEIKKINDVMGFHQRDDWYRPNEITRVARTAQYLEKLKRHSRLRYDEM